MKIIILSEVEQFCRDHNFNMIGLETLRSLAIEPDENGIQIAYKAGYGKCCEAVIVAMSEAKP